MTNLNKNNFDSIKVKSEGQSLMATIGSFGSAITVGLCPICIPAVGALLSSFGLGFLVNEDVLQPLLIMFIIFGWTGFIWSFFKEHKKVTPLILGIVAGIFLYVGRYVYLGGRWNAILMYGGVFFMVSASILNMIFRKRNSKCSTCTSKESPS